MIHFRSTTEGFQRNGDGTPFSTTTRSTPQRSTSTVRYMYDNISSTSIDDHPNGLEFVFVIGLEGTGHHFIRSLIQGSPFWKIAEQWKIAPDHISTLHDALFHSNRMSGLWNAPCRELINYNPSPTPITTRPGQNSRGKTLSSRTSITSTKKVSRQLTTKQEILHSSTSAQNQVVSELRAIKEIYDTNKSTLQPPPSQQEPGVGQQQHQQPPNPPFRVPINTAGLSSTFGMVSYPNFGRPSSCRKLQYPSLELLYAACDDADVACSHVYLYRDPIEVLRSTSITRKFNPSDGLAASHLYTSMLKIIESQLVAYPDKTRGCLGFFDEDDTARDEWKAIVRKLWGWQIHNDDSKEEVNAVDDDDDDFGLKKEEIIDDDGEEDKKVDNDDTLSTSNKSEEKDDFDIFLQKTYKKPSSSSSSSTTTTTKKKDESFSLLAENHRPYLDLFHKAHERTLQVCREGYYDTMEAKVTSVA
jgi:hypothetical protein